MSRQRLLQQLAAHAPSTEEEAAMRTRLAEFVTDHEDCFDRALTVGHVTGSAWIVDRERTHVLLTHHRKLDKWLQLGGHADGDADVLRVAMREACEESGLQTLSPVSESIFDVDIHAIPARNSEPEHFHYDVRYALEADRTEGIVLSDESHELRWVPVEEVRMLTEEESVLRMVRKTRLL
ncbi:MAG: NUDIX hydrolase [Bryobacterales bacterium]|nr:NUDIX hydrolase [Bryobacterales bacterium]